jgi:hypothetical protein
VNRDASAANIGRLIGMEVAQRTAADLPAIELTEAGKAKLGADPATIGGPRPISPSFAVAESQPGVEVLGRYAGTGEAAIAMKSGGGCPTVFWGGLQVPASALRALARLAGAHIYCDSDDIVGAGPGFVSLHVTTAGEKTISLPERWPAVVDLITGETIARRTNGFTLAMEAGETRLIGRAAPAATD